MKMMMSSKAKANIFRILGILIFGTFSQLYVNRFDVEYFSIEYLAFFLFTILICLVTSIEDRLLTKHNKENEEILEKIENATKYRKSPVTKKES
jgi:hypothetical protein